MWPALFPEISARHEWVGFADADVLFGDLAAEVDLLTARDDLLVPSSWHPYPLANGNFMLFRAMERVLHAFRGAGWRFVPCGHHISPHLRLDGVAGSDRCFVDRSGRLT